MENRLNDAEQKAVLSLAMMAAFADGDKDERERVQLRQVAESLTAGGATGLAAVYQDVLLKRASLDDAVRSLTVPEHRQLAYEMAVCVCDSDGARNAAESGFLEKLRDKLALPSAPAQTFAAQADRVADVPVSEASALEPVYASTLTPAGLDKMILNYAILNGALELLPQSLASMAIIPLQMKMVYRIGKSYGFELDRGHIREFLATVGVGLTSQYLEQIGTKLLGGLLGKVGGGLFGKVGRQATSSAFSFASTYALGHVAKRYYAGGRTLSTESLKSAFNSLLGEAKGLQQRYAGEIESKSRAIDWKQLLQVARS
jgi:uncharacterized protein (DUF697 family)/tellurite resistance protein